MKPAQFEMRRPTRLEEVVALLDEFGADARLIAGGQSLVPLMNLRMVTPSLLIDLNRVQGLSGVQLDDGILRIGAMTRQHVLLTDPLVAVHAPLIGKAIPHIGHGQTRNRGTIGGSLAHADPSAELPLTIVALGATLRTRSAQGERTLSARGFFEDVLTTALQPGEVLIGIDIPVAPAGTRTSFVEFARRHGDFAITACAAQFVPDPGPTRLQVALGGVAKVPHYCAQLCADLAAARFSRSAVEDIVATELALLSPMGDLHATPALRLQLAKVALSQCLMEILP